MGPKSRREWLEAIGPRYRKACKKGKGKILDEFCAVCGYERKYAIRLLGRWRRPTTPSRRSGRRATYGGEELKVLKVIWLHSEQPCSKRLRAALGLWLPHYEARFGRLEAAVRRRLLRMSPATMDRLLASQRARLRRVRCATRPGSLLRTQIPIHSGPWDVQGPGWVEADTVAHCGDSLAGNFVWSLTFTDIWSGWTEMRAVWNRGAQGVLEQIAHIERGLAFALLGFDCDNGSEFLNHHLVRYFAQRPKVVAFTRSRPYHKNDNAHVEQKQWTHVRQLLGYDRLDNSALVEPLNQLYAGAWSQFHNFFQPSMKLQSKERLGAKYRRRYEPPQTPYQRLMASSHLTAKAKAHLAKLFKNLDPFELKQQVEVALRHLRKLRLHPNSTPTPRPTRGQPLSVSF
jgi:hypothetical protein